MNTASPPASRIRRTVSSPPATTMSDTATFAPSLARASDAARPMPDPPPVTNTIFPCTNPAILDLLHPVTCPLLKRAKRSKREKKIICKSRHCIDPTWRYQQPISLQRASGGAEVLADKMYFE